MVGVSVNREEQIEEYNKCLDEHNLYKKENQQAYDQALVIFLTSTFGFSFLAVAYIGGNLGNFILHFIIENRLDNFVCNNSLVFD